MNGDDERKPSQAVQLIEIGRTAELWHTPAGEAFATVDAGGHKENLPLKSMAFREWLNRRFYEESRGKSAAGGAAMQTAIEVLSGNARFAGKERESYVRLAHSQDRVYLDLGDSEWRAVEVSPTGWRVVDNAPVRFRRARGMLALPDPVHDGSLDVLREYVNTPDDDAWTLLLAWLVAIFSSGPYPVLILQGEQGSAKSFTARVLRSLVDPNSSGVRTAPRDAHDLMIAARNSWVIAYDNLSGLPPWLSDAVCRLATGGGFATRELYSDLEETLIEAKRPVVVNGIDDMAARDDLRDRSIILTLPAIAEADRREEGSLWAAFEADRPAILGGLLDAVAVALLNKSTTHLARLPRMADFAKWVVAAEPALPWEAGHFLTAYAENRQAAVETGLADSVLAQTILAHIETAGEMGWTGTAKQLLEVLGGEVEESVRRSKNWPSSTRSLGNRLRRLAPALRAVGVSVDFMREAHTRRRLILIRKDSGNDVPNVPNVPAETETVSKQGILTGVAEYSGDVMGTMGTMCPRDDINDVPRI